MKDKQGREYAKITQIDPGTLVTVDGDFTCLDPWTIHEVKYDKEEGVHYIECKHGRHDLGGQSADNDIHLVGIYLGKIEL